MNRKQALSNARIQVLVNGDDVTLTLRPGQTLHHYSGGPDEEGFSYTAESWSLSNDAEQLRRSYYTQASDCDGRFDSGGEDVADADPATWHRGHDPYKYRAKRWPYWIQDDYEQRDHAAEAAGF